MNGWRKFGAVSILVAGATLLGLDAGAESTGEAVPTQVLDRVNAVSSKAVLDMAFDDPASALPFETPPEVTTARGFTSCQLTAERGLFCLDQNASGAPGRFVRRWDPVFRDGEVGNPYFSCESLPGVDISRNVETCTGITADDNGAVVVAGKRKGGYNLVKVAPKDDLPGKTCASPWAPLGSTSLCFKILLPRDRPLLVDVSYAELTFPAGSSGTPVQCTGIIGLENRTTLMFFTDRDADEKNDESCGASYAEVPLVETKSWGLNRGEVLQGATPFRIGDNSYVLVISSHGRVFAKQTNVAGTTPFPVTITGLRYNPETDGKQAKNFVNVADLRDSRTSKEGAPAARCDSTSQEFGIRTSTKSGRLYVSDENFCEVSAFEPSGAALVTDGDGLELTTFGGWDLVLSTKTQPSGTAYPVLEPTLAPGISIDLTKCASADGCTLVAGGNGQRLASLGNVKLASTAKGMTLYQVQGLPDCRWITANRPAVCDVDADLDGKADAVIGNGPPERQYLNITPLLPKEVTDQFPDGLPVMVISPQYRAQLQNGYYFEAFFGVTQKGVIFQDVFSLEFAVGDLNVPTSRELGCVATPRLGSSVADLLKWDISVTVSEKVKVVGSSDAWNADMLVNDGCGSTKGAAVRWSAYTYDLEMTPKVYGLSAAGSTPDDYFVHLAVDLFFDLETARKDYACPAGGPLATSGVCTTLASSWLNANDKLVKCLKDSYAPKTSEAVRNCNSFLTQLANYRATLNTVPLCTVATTTCGDPENRLGELKARVDTLRHVVNDRLIPSVPQNGFVDFTYRFNPDGSLKDPNLTSP
jgi:hypothetical protein